MSINPLDFYKEIKIKGIDFFTGVPDSLLKELCLCIEDNNISNNHIIAANEGNAIAIASGYHLGTGKIPLVYMQNSGLGNAINPLLSLCDNKVYSIPLIMIIGWRGEPGIKDEPQHIKQGKIQVSLLKSMGIKSFTIDKNMSITSNIISSAINEAKSKNEPIALVIKKGTFSKYQLSKKNIILQNRDLMTRERSLEVIIKNLLEDTIVVSTTGKTSREIFEIRDKIDKDHSKDFLSVGSMGHCSSIALGIAISNPNKKVICIDGDGSLLMHLGSLSTIAKVKPKNFYHILINNQVHESVGGQETSIKYINVLGLVKSNNYKKIYSINNEIDLESVFKLFLNSEGPNFLEINVKSGSRDNLGRPYIKPIDNKKEFMKYIIKNNK